MIGGVTDMAKYNRYSKRKTYKLRKTRAWVSVVGFILIIITVYAFLWLAYYSVVNYLVDTKVNSQTDRVKTTASIYGKYDADDPVMARDYFSLEWQDFFIEDGNGSILYQHGADTCDRTGFSKDAFNDDEANVTLFSIDDEDQEELNFTVDDIFDNGSVIYLNDTGSDGIIYVKNDLVRLDYKKFNSIDTLTTIFSDKDIRISRPYWTCIASDDESTYIFVKTSVDIKVFDLVVFMTFGAFLGLIVVIVSVALLVDLIRNIIDKVRIRKLLFYDNISNGHNFTWFVIHGEELLSKHHREIGNYAVVNLAFVQYRRYVLCHSVQDGEALLRKFYAILSDNLEKKELAAHSTTANFPILIRFTDDDQLKARLKGIISKLESVSLEQRFNFQAGVKKLVSEGEERKIRAKDIDLDLEYNNSCAARASMEKTEDSGIAFFDQALVDDQKWINNVSESQASALEKEEFVVYYQPKYDPRTDELEGAEALIRWNSEKFGFVSPGKFIPIFEANGFIKEIDHYMIAHVARDQKAWIDKGLKCVPVSVNVSRAHFVETDLAEEIRDIVDKEGCPHDLIEIELTESAFFDNKEVLLTTIDKLKEYGFSVSMDDFGSGYSSLNSLKDLPLDVLKLDAGFFRNISEDGRGEIVVSEAIKLAKSLNMKTVAEGVEEKTQVDFLATEGCDMIQGYYYAKPMPGNEYETRMKG